MATTKPKAIIVGGGISGLSAAYWLDKAGWESLIIERSAANRKGGFLIGLTGVGYESTKHMAVFDPLQALSYDMSDNIVKTTAGREVVRMNFHDAHGLDSFALRRGDLAETLFKALPASATVRYGETVTDFVDHGDAVEVSLKSGGPSLRCDLLIGADGIHSGLRSQLFKGMAAAAPLVDLGYSYAVYDVASIRDNEIESTCVSYTRPGHLDCFYRLRDNRVAGMHIWRDDYLGADLAPLRNESGQAAYDRLHAIARGGHPQVDEIVSRAEAAGSPVVVDTLTMVKLPTWSQGRAMLLGDAAHCLTLLSGQGAAMAMASAEILGRELTSHNNDVVAALAAHDKHVRPAIVRLQDHTVRLASAYIPRNALLYHLRNWMVKLLPYSWLIAWHTKKVQAEVDLTKL